ncbi:hypothetical protein mRhiFer1_010074 [Rhinolophus ferrumequinum]|uniref:DDE-1 domain-containing protein n=1 Tax=Rhinolophus ferrumequinum TaxID=59479 RepID=A0A7J7Y599_RHIFE|nr:hypothetical protein mRhiFer1_010074 [Rhinolophus ferrumequinum]
MTQLLFQDPLLNCYASRENYSVENNTPFKIVLIVNNDSEHPPFTGDLHLNIKLLFHHPNTTSVIHPMDEGVIAAFKACYLKKTVAQAIAATEEDCEKTLMQFWKDYNITDSTKNLFWAWDNVIKECMSGIWKKTSKDFPRMRMLQKSNRVWLRWQTT